MRRVESVSRRSGPRPNSRARVAVGVGEEESDVARFARPVQRCRLAGPAAPELRDRFPCLAVGGNLNFEAVGGALLRELPLDPHTARTSPRSNQTIASGVARGRRPGGGRIAVVGGGRRGRGAVAPTPNIASGPRFLGVGRATPGRSPAHGFVSASTILPKVTVQYHPKAESGLTARPIPIALKRSLSRCSSCDGEFCHCARVSAASPYPAARFSARLVWVLSG